MGGILGLSLSNCDKCTSAWKWPKYSGHTFEIALAPETDFEWLYDNFEEERPAHCTSWLAFFNHSAVKSRETGDKITLSSEHSNDEWRYKASSMKFAGAELMAQDMEDDGPTHVEVSMGLSSIGLPEAEYLTVARKLYGQNSKIQCHSTIGSQCHTDMSCTQLLPKVKSNKFRLEFDNSDGKTDYVELPLAALLRQQDQGCNILITNLGKNTQASNIVLGSAFLQQFMVEFSPADASKNSQLVVQKQMTALADSKVGSGTTGAPATWVVVGALFLILVCFGSLFYMRFIRNRRIEEKKKDMTSAVNQTAHEETIESLVGNN